MALRLALYLPGKRLNDVQALEQLIIDLGDRIAVDFGNDIPADEFELENLNSFIIIDESENPSSENFEDASAFLVIPVGDI